MKVKEESEKVGLKLNIQKTKTMASGPITSWQIDGETVTDFILGGSKITADGDYSHEIKRRLLLGRKVMTNLDSIFKSRDSTLLTKVRLVKAVVHVISLVSFLCFSLWLSFCLPSDENDKILGTSRSGSRVIQSEDVVARELWSI